MNEEIRNNEISEEQLENVSGGSNYPETCPHCGSKMIEDGTLIMCNHCCYMFTSLPPAGDGYTWGFPTKVP